MNRGFYLTLMMGGFNASPVPQPVIDALSEVQVNSMVGSQGGFQLKFTLGKNSPVQQMLGSGFFEPRTRAYHRATGPSISGPLSRQRGASIVVMSVPPSSNGVSGVEALEYT